MAGIKHRDFYSWNPLGPQAKPPANEEEMLQREFSQAKFCKVCGKEIFLEAQAPAGYERESRGTSDPDIWKIEFENNVHQLCYLRNRHLFDE